MYVYITAVFSLLSIMCIILSFDLLLFRTFILGKIFSYAFGCVYQLQKGFGFYQDLQIFPTPKKKAGRRRKQLLGQLAEVLSCQIRMKRAEECHTFKMFRERIKKRSIMKVVPSSLSLRDGRVFSKRGAVHCVTASSATPSASPSS